MVFVQSAFYENKHIDSLIDGIDKLTKYEKSKEGLLSFPR